MQTLVGVRIRREVHSGAKQPGGWTDDLIWYGRAVKAMRQRGIDDPTGWDFLAAVHGTYRTAKTPAQKEAWDQCQHATWYFLPWHRMYLHIFESAVRATISKLKGPGEQWALPYWKYEPSSKESRLLPEPFGQPTWDHGDKKGEPNPLYTPARRPGLNERKWALPAQATSHEAAFLHTYFAGNVVGLDFGFGGGASKPWHVGRRFTGALEALPHNAVHVMVGGDQSSENCGGAWMSDENCAGLDPIFWLHHANIDRLWVKWLELNGGRANPTESDWRDQEFVFYDAGGRRTMKPMQVEKTEDLGYRYDDQAAYVLTRRRSAVAAPGPMAAAGEQREPELLAAAPEPVELTGQQVQVPVALRPAAARAMRDSVSDLVGPQAAGGTTTGPSVFLALEGLEADRVPGVIYEVLVNVPEEAKPERQAEYAVGVISFFGMRKRSNQEHGGDQGHATGYVFDITGLVAQLIDEGRWREDQITVTLRPIGMEPAGDEAAPVAASVESHPAVRVGRVSLFRA